MWLKYAGYKRGINLDGNLQNLLDELAASNAEIYLMNVYKGVPLSFPAVITGGGARGLHVQADRYQVACMYIEKETYIRSERLPHILSAQVIDLDLAGRTAFLAGFLAGHGGIGSRMQVRVELEEPLGGKLQNHQRGRFLKGELVDLSQDGLGFYLDGEDIPAAEFFKGARVSVCLHLPGQYEKGSRKTAPLSPERPGERFERGNVRFSPFGSPEKGMPAPGTGPLSGQTIQSPEVLVQGTVAHILRESGRGRWRVGVRTDSNDPSRPLIGQVIVQRQAEIIREIKALYDLLLEKPET
jgi:hypothetical protein